MKENDIQQEVITEEKDFKKIFKEFRDRLWKTYKIRINTAERLKKNNSIVAFLSIFYSAMLSAISILNFSNCSKEMDLITIVLSVIVTILFLFFEGKGFKDRHRDMKINYNNLSLLYYEVELYCNNNTEYKEEKFEEFTKRYVKLLNDVENHSNEDYYLYMLNKSEANWWMIIKYYAYKCLFWIFIILLILIPIACFAMSLCELIWKIKVI